MIRNRTLAGATGALLLLLAAATAAPAQEVDPLGALRARQLYLEGQPDQAFALVRPLAEAGDLQAQVTLGYFYAHGIGTPRDEAKAIALFEAAAERNHAAALFNLAVSYEHGTLGLPEDMTRAHALFVRGAGLDHPPALYRLALIYLNKARATDAGLPYDPSLGVALLERAVTTGHPQAAAELAFLLQRGDEAPQDLARARKLFLIAAAHGVGRAQIAYADMVEKGHGGPADRVEAEVWFRRAQADGTSEGAIRLARLLTRNSVPGQDRQIEALAWCLWYHAHQPVTPPADPMRRCTWARTGLGPDEVASAQALAQTF